MVLGDSLDPSTRHDSKSVSSHRRSPHRIPMTSCWLGILVCIILSSCCCSEATEKFGLYMLRSPENTVAPIGDEVVFECAFNVNPDRIDWRFRPQGVSKGVKSDFVYLSKSTVYNITPSTLGILVSPDTVGDYQCIAWYGGVSALASSTAQLSLVSISLPKNASTPERRQTSEWRVSPGNTVIIKCGEVDSNPPAIWNYYRENNIIHPVEPQLQTGGGLVISSVSAKDSGMYWCSAINPITSAEKKMPSETRLIVETVPKMSPIFLTQPPAVVKVNPGETAILECPCIGNPVPKAIWSRPDGMISNNRTSILSFGLQIVNVMPSDRGNYYCNADNGIAPQLRHTVLLEVLEVPTIIKAPMPTLINESDSFSMECVAIGNPKPVIRWMLNGDDVQWDNDIKTNGSMISIKSVEKRHAGFIQCFAKNEAGEVSESNLLQVKPKQILNGGDAFPFGSVQETMKPSLEHGGKPPRGKKKHKHRKFFRTIMIPPSKPNVTRLSDESVMVRWSASSDDGLPIQFFKVQYRMLGNASGTAQRGQWMTSSEDIPPPVRSYEVKELKPDHYYRFRIAAVYSNNDNKLGVASGKFHLQKASQLNPAKSHLAVPNLQKVEGISETAIVLHWNFPNQPPTPVDGFYAYFRPSSTAGEYSKATIDGMFERQFRLDHLEPGTAYEFKLQSFTASAASDFSAILMGKTLAPPTQRPPTVSTIEDDIEPSRKPSYLIIIIVSVIILILLIIASFCLCKKCRQSREEEATESKAHPADIQASDANGFATITSSLHKNNHNRSINITSNPLAQETTDKNRNVMELRFLPNSTAGNPHTPGLPPAHNLPPIPNNHMHHHNNNNNNNYTNNINNMNNNNLHFVDGLPRRTLERGVRPSNNGMVPNGIMGSAAMINDLHQTKLNELNSSMRMPPMGRRNSGSNNNMTTVPGSPRVIRGGISSEFLHQGANIHHRSPMPKRAATSGVQQQQQLPPHQPNNMKRNILRNENVSSGSIEV